MKVSSETRVARDSQGIRLYAACPEDLHILRTSAPYEVLDDGETVMFVSHSGHLQVSSLHGYDRVYEGLRANDEERMKTKNNEGTFGPYEIYIEFQEDGSFEFQLPAIHNLPWPRLSAATEDLGGRIIQCLVERATSQAVECHSTPIAELRQLRAPMYIRRFLSAGLLEAARERMWEAMNEQEKVAQEARAVSRSSSACSSEPTVQAACGAGEGQGARAQGTGPRSPQEGDRG